MKPSIISLPSKRRWEGQRAAINSPFLYAESNGATDILHDCGGAPCNPFEQDEDGLGVTALKKMATQLNYHRESGHNIIDISL